MGSTGRDYDVIPSRESQRELYFDFLEYFQYGWCDWWVDSFYPELPS